MDVKELKAQAYDLIAKHEAHMVEIQKIKKELDSLNSEIYKIVNKESDEAVSS